MYRHNNSAGSLICLSAQRFHQVGEKTSWLLDRLEREVLGGRLWHAACQDLNTDLPALLPLSFSTAAEYVATFEPLLFEEARESVRADWAEAAEAAHPRVWSATVVRCADAAAHPKCLLGVLPEGSCTGLGAQYQHAGLVQQGLSWQ